MKISKADLSSRSKNQLTEVRTMEITDSVEKKKD